MDILTATLELYLEAAPWLLLGLVVAGLVKAWMPEGAIGRFLGGSGPGPVVKAALIGAPLPLCSCGVLPAAVGLRRGGASKGATVSFMVATPETRPDSIALSYALLGPFMAVVRPVAAVFSAVGAGLLAGLAKEAPPAGAEDAGCDDGCCRTEKPEATPSGLGPGLRYAFTDVLDDIAPSLVVGLLLAGFVAAYVPPMALAELGSGLLAMLVMLVAGIPIYVCATSSTPLATAFLLAGVSPGAVLVFLLAGPATNIATLSVVRRTMGGGALTGYLAGIALGALGFGLATDWLVARWDLGIAAQMAETAELLPAWLKIASGVLLAIPMLPPTARAAWRLVSRGHAPAS